ncbi:hypothetical protein FACS189483_05590 [Spirochaetia bacterium]|nr:hypothetical protein FACS189483_05590 [Spirochaetia bacterium]
MKLTSEEKAILRILFQNKLYKADGQRFEDIFTQIMNYAEPDFQQIKPWGNIGDRKNDGYIKSKGIYFQVYAPEDSENSYLNIIKKIETDFSGLMRQWSATNPINEFYFVINDKFKGVHPDAEQAMTRIIKQNHLKKGGFRTSKDIENLLFTLADDQINTIAGFIPDPAKIKSLNFSVLDEVIDRVRTFSLAKAIPPDIKVPDWDEKIKFNNLSPQTALLLNNGSMQITSLDKYLNSQGNFLADELRDKMNEIYIDEKRKNMIGDDLFWGMVNKVSPKSEQVYQTAVIVIMAKYFEACDIFERPLEEKA